ncbi:MAG: FAD:protein FMN transferase [Candidatus Nomurabacteria bacterium]|nr:FAD:protein FMN transferase [Candidatus Nomurabacteria bacterium]
MIEFSFEGIGTKWQIEIYQELTKESEEKLFSSIKNRIDIFDKDYSRFRDDSLVTKMSKEIGIYNLPSDADPMMSLYYDLYKRTDGLFTPLVGNLLSDAGYDAKYSLSQKKDLEIPPKWEEVMDYKFPKLNIKKPVILDFGAGGKGYLIDLVSKVIEENNILKYCIDAGGDILYKNDTPIRVGLENPKNFEEVIGLYPLTGGSICGSAGSRRKWGEFNHIMNPKTLTPATEIIAVWVVADIALLADSIATCLFFVPAEILNSFYKFEYILVKADFSTEKSADFKGELFS